MAITPAVARGKVGSKSINAALNDVNRLESYTVATLPAAASHTGKLVYVSNGAAGSPCLAYSNGTSWLRSLLGVAVAAS
jgi:hypothetical protein